MEIGACLELSTIAYPKHFLALACSANLLKNLAAVAASSTRAPIYRSFALQNNLADVTAKGESVANLSDILGVAFGIGLSRFNWPIGVNFLVLSTGYLIASRKEVDSVILPYMNQACSHRHCHYIFLQPAVFNQSSIALRVKGCEASVGCCCSAFEHWEPASMQPHPIPTLGSLMPEGSFFISSASRVLSNRENV